MQTKLIFRGPAKSAMADSVWSREEGQGRFVQWYAKYAAYEIVISLYTQPPTHLVASDIQLKHVVQQLVQNSIMQELKHVFSTGVQLYVA